MNIIQSVKKLFELTDAKPITDRQSLYDLEQAGQKMYGMAEKDGEITSQTDNQGE